MNKVIYIAMLLPAVIMIIAGVVISSAKKDATISHHHFADNFNIKKFSRKVISLFTLSGILFSLGGFLTLFEHYAIGLAVIIITLIVFIVLFIKIERKQ